MKLYKKQLNSLEELKREQYLLQYIKKQQSSPLSAEGLARPKKRKKSATASPSGSQGVDLSELLLSLAGSESLTDVLFKASGPALKLAARKFPKKFFRRAAREFIGGYAKWKLVSGGVFLLRQLLEIRRENKRRAREDKNRRPTSQAHAQAPVR